MFRRLALALVLSSAAFVWAEPNCQEMVPKALTQYGVDDSLKNFPAQMKAQMSAQLEQNSSLPDEAKQKLAEALQRGMSVDRLTKNVQQTLVSSCDPAEMKTVLDQLQSPLLQKMRALEGASSSPDTTEKLRHNFELPEVQSPPAKRAQLIQRLMTATGATDVMTDTIIETSRGLMEGMGAPPLSDQQVAELRGQIDSRSREKMQTVNLAVYHDATDEELEQYISIQNSKPFHDFNNQVSKAMVKGFAEESRHAGEELKKTLDAMKAQAPPAPASH